MTITAAQDPQEWLDTYAVAREYGVSHTTAWRLLKEPGAPVFAIGARPKVRRGEFEAWMRTRSLRAAGTA